jgi:uncharacterized membrane protein (UPF0136 family)
MSLLCIVGGSTAFYKKSSIPSLVAGLSYVVSYMLLILAPTRVSHRVGLLYLWSGSQIGEGEDVRGFQAAFRECTSALLH